MIFKPENQRRAELQRRCKEAFGVARKAQRDDLRSLCLKPIGDFPDTAPSLITGRCLHTHPTEVSRFVESIAAQWRSPGRENGTSEVASPHKHWPHLQ